MCCWQVLERPGVHFENDAITSRIGKCFMMNGGLKNGGYLKSKLKLSSRSDCLGNLLSQGLEKLPSVVIESTLDFVNSLIFNHPQLTVSFSDEALVMANNYYTCKKIKWNVNISLTGVVSMWRSCTDCESGSCFTNSDGLSDGPSSKINCP